jgi:hypothetical protein
VLCPSSAVPTRGSMVVVGMEDDVVGTGTVDSMVGRGEGMEVSSGLGVNVGSGLTSSVN